MTKKSRDRRKYLRWKKRQVYAGEFITMSIEEIKEQGFIQHECNGITFNFIKPTEFNYTVDLGKIPVTWVEPIKNKSGYE